MASDNNDNGHRLPGWDGVLGAALLGGIIAAVINVIVWVVVGQDIQVPNQGSSTDMMDLTLAMVAIASVVPAFFAGVIAKIAVHSAARAALVISIMGVVGFVVSLGGPLTIEDAPTGDIDVLIVMHVVATGAIIGLLIRRYRVA